MQSMRSLDCRMYRMLVETRTAQLIRFLKMTEPSSRTPEGIPHRCSVCGMSFRINAAISGDACCPNCNSLAWLIGEDGLEIDDLTANGLQDKIKEIRLRPRDVAAEIDKKTKRAIALLRKYERLKVSVVFVGHGPKVQRECKGILDRFLKRLVPDHAKVMSPSTVLGRRMSCVLSPNSDVTEN
ncbi:hypothetical protein [Roseiconus lacunae]|uniref:hypothetical protein n=1 Tax=Roseiconus lacunae TaxID=2605694 RepID=UPI003F52DE4B